MGERSIHIHQSGTLYGRLNQALRVIDVPTQTTTPGLTSERLQRGSGLGSCPTNSFLQSGRRRVKSIRSDLGPVIEFSEVGGLHHRCERIAA